MKNTIIAILVIVILALGFFIFNQKKSSPANEPWPETIPANPGPTSGNPTTGTNPCAPSIIVSAPATGAAYTVGQQVTVKWTTCGVSKVLLGLVSGGKDHGMITQNSISSSMGTYQWTATNPGKGFTNQNTNSYQIVVDSDGGNVMARSGVFTVTTPESTSVQLDMSNSYAQTYRTLFTAEFSKPANLDSHFRLVPVGCGSGCMDLYALDKNTGKTYKIGSSNYMEYYILDNQVRATLQDGQMMIYLFNPQKEEFNGTAV